MDGETIQLILDLGASGANVEDVRKKLEGLKGSVHSTADTYEVLERQVGEYEVLERRVTETVRIQATMLDQLGIQLNRQAGLYQVVTAEAARLGQTVGRQGDLGRGMLQASFMVQDFTSVMGDGGLVRAFGSVQNNIPILLTGLGMGAGLAGAVSVVSIGVGLLIANWGKLTGLWDEEETKKEAERQKDLAKAIEETAKAAEKLAKTLPRTEREGQAGFKKAVDEFGGAAVLKELEEALKARQGSFGAEADRKMAQTLFANLMQGDRQAHALLGDLDLRGDVGEVLRGGMTPKEQQAANRRRGEREAKERDKAREEAAKEKAKKDKEVADLEEENEKWVADMERSERARKQKEQTKEAAKEAAAMDDLHKDFRKMRESPQAQMAPQIRQVQEEVFQGSGMRITPQQAMAMIKRQQQQLDQAQEEQAAAMMEMASGMGEQIQMMKRNARALRQRNQAMNNSGWN